MDTNELYHKLRSAHKMCQVIKDDAKTIQMYIEWRLQGDFVIELDKKMYKRDIADQVAQINEAVKLLNNVEFD